MGLVVLTSPSFWDMQEVPCHKEEEVMATRWSFFGEKWKTTTEVPGIASMVLLRGTGDLLEISQSGKGTLKMKFSAFTHHSLQKFGYQLYKLFFSLLCEIIKLWKFDITYWINSSSKVNVVREKHSIISILRSLLFRIGTKSSLSSILHFLVVIALISMHEIHLVDLVTLVLSGLIGLMQYANLNPNAPKWPYILDPNAI